jgi:hypothetical protein
VATNQSVVRRVGLCLMVAVAGAVLGRAFWPSAAAHSSPRSLAPAPSPAAPTGPGPLTTVDGVPAGFTDTRAGAAAAAASFVCTGQAVLDMDALSVEAAVRELAAAASGAGQVADTLAKLAAIRDQLSGGSGPIRYEQAALAYRVDAFQLDRANVSVWSVGVLSRTGVAPPQAGWTTSSIDLVWERGDWRVWSESITPGPAPILNNSTAPATAEVLATDLAGFAEYGSRP